MDEHDVQHDLLEQALAAMVEGELSLEQQEQLVDLLHDNADTQLQFVRYVSMHAWLEWDQSQKRDLETSAPTNTTPPERARSLLQRASRYPLMPSIGVAVVVFVAILLGMALTPVGQWIAGGGKDAESRQPEGPTSSKFAAILNSRRNVTWLEGSRPSLSDPRLAVGQRLVFASGLIEVKYYTGASVVIEGPAEFVVGATEPGELARGEAGRGSRSRSGRGEGGSLDAANSGFLLLGSLVARVEGEKAQGFTIETPNVRIEDHGTEFGVEVDGRGTAEVVVLSGEVDVVGETSDGRQQRVRLTEDQGAFVANNIARISRRKKIDARLIAAMRSRLKELDRKPIVVVARAEHFQQDQSATTNTIARFKVSPGDDRKLVLAASWESANSNIRATWKGSEMFTTAVNSAGGRNSAILYLDDPTPGIGDIVVTFGEPTASRIGVVGLMNTAEGVFETTNAKGTAGQLTKTEPAMFVMGVYTTNDHSGGKIQGPFSHTLYSGESGSSRGDAGYQGEAKVGLKNYAWEVPGPAQDNHVLAAFVDASHAPAVVPEDEDDTERVSESQSDK